MAGSTFIREVIDHTLRAVGTTAHEIHLWQLEQTVLCSLRGSAFEGRQVSVYIARRSASERAQRARAIRALWNGANASALAAQFGLSERQIWRIVGAKPSEHA